MLPREVEGQPPAAWIRMPTGTGSKAVAKWINQDKLIELLSSDDYTFSLKTSQLIIRPELKPPSEKFERSSSV